MFSVAYREQVSSRVLEWAECDHRIVAGGTIGCLAHGQGDRWSDLDLSFAVANDEKIANVLEGWTERLVSEFDAIHLFDLPSGSSIYRGFVEGLKTRLAEGAKTRKDRKVTAAQDGDSMVCGCSNR